MLVQLLGRFSAEDEVELNISLRKMMLKTVSFPSVLTRCQVLSRCIYLRLY